MTSDLPAILPVTIGPAPRESAHSHLPLLKAAVLATTGPVLELGAGDGSTRMLNEICSSIERPLLTIENAWKWYKKLVELRSDFHRFAFVYNWDEAPLLPTVGERWGVVLVDLSPGPARRAAVGRFQGAADIVIAHDTEPKHNKLYGYSDDLWNRFRFTLHDERTNCRTTALSDRVDMSSWIFA